MGSRLFTGEVSRLCLPSLLLAGTELKQRVCLTESSSLHKSIQKLFRSKQPDFPRFNAILCLDFVTYSLSHITVPPAKADCPQKLGNLAPNQPFVMEAAVSGLMVADTRIQEAFKSTDTHRRFLLLSLQHSYRQASLSTVRVGTSTEQLAASAATCIIWLGLRKTHKHRKRR